MSDTIDSCVLTGMHCDVTVLLTTQNTKLCHDYCFYFHFIAFCGAGLQISDPEQPTNCTACPMGYYKAAPSYDPCAPCQTDRTSNEERTACDVCKYQLCCPLPHPWGTTRPCPAITPMYNVKLTIPLIRREQHVTYVSINCTAPSLGYYQTVPSYNPYVPCQTDRTSN